MEEQEKIRIMLDTNAFDKLIEVGGIDVSYSEKIQFFITNIQIKELASIPDEKIDKRINVFMMVCNLRPTIIPIAFSFSNLTFSHLKYSGGEIVSDIRKENGSNEKDALIADAAVKEGCILITNDSELSKKMLKINKQAMTYENFALKYMQ